MEPSPNTLTREQVAKLAQHVFNQLHDENMRPYQGETKEGTMALHVLAKLAAMASTIALGDLHSRVVNLDDRRPPKP